MGSACLSIIDSSYHLSAILLCLLSMESTMLSSHTLANNLGVLVDKDLGFSARLVHSSGRNSEEA